MSIQQTAATADLFNDLPVIEKPVNHPKREIGFESQALARLTKVKIAPDADDPNLWRVLWAHGVMHDGSAVRVSFKFPITIPRLNGLYADTLIQICKDHGRYGKQVGIFDKGVVSTKH